jgi:hypothetical protein
MPADVATHLQPVPLYLAPVGVQAVALDFNCGCLSPDAMMSCAKTSMINSA